MNDPTCYAEHLLFSLSSLISPEVDLLIIMTLHRYLKPSADSGETHSNLEILPNPNAEIGGESARAVVSALKKK